MLIELGHLNLSRDRANKKALSCHPSYCSHVLYILWSDTKPWFCHHGPSVEDGFMELDSRVFENLAYLLCSRIAYTTETKAAYSGSAEWREFEARNRNWVFVRKDSSHVLQWFKDSGHSKIHPFQQAYESACTSYLRICVSRTQSWKRIQAWQSIGSQWLTIAQKWWIVLESSI